MTSRSELKSHFIAVQRRSCANPRAIFDRSHWAPTAWQNITPSYNQPSYLLKDLAT